MIRSIHSIFIFAICLGAMGLLCMGARFVGEMIAAGGPRMWPGIGCLFVAVSVAWHDSKKL